MKKYIGLDYLRAISCIGIVAMHMRSNNAYHVSGFFYNSIIDAAAQLVYLFMAVSAFGMCCGYYEKVLSGKVNWTVFYKRRYEKILPFFAILLVIQLLVEFSTRNVVEGLAELTMLHGFIPREMTVLGVAWFLGVVFIFYLVFPFFCVLLETRRRGLLAFAVGILLSFLCERYFGLGNRNFLFCFSFFLLGGVIFLYREPLSRIPWPVSAGAVVLAWIFYFRVDTGLPALLPATAVMLIAGIGEFWKPNRAVSFVSDLSMEIYLSHMVVFRGLEKLHLTTVIGHGWIQYLFTLTAVLAGTMVFALCCRFLLGKVSNLHHGKVGEK